MAITEVAYCTREDVQRALSLADAPQLNNRIDQAVMAGARQAEGLLHRKFHPLTTTRSFDQPSATNLWLYQHELAAAPTSITSGGVAMTVGTDVFLRPIDGPPYRWLEVSYGGTVFWQSQSTPQNAIVITGEYHYPTVNTVVGTLASSPTSSSPSVLLSDSSMVGVGSLILVDTERMQVSEKAMTTTGATVTADPTSAKSATTLAVSSGALVNPGEMILVDAERMQVEYVTGNSLTVRRAVNGSALAAHTIGATVYAPRSATVQRAKYGSTAAAHSAGATVTLIQAPGLVRELNLAYAVNNNEAALAAYSRTAAPDMTSIYRDRGRGIVDLETDAMAAYGRQQRSRAV